MRIAVSNRTNGIVGGVERYLRRIISELRLRGFDIGFICEEAHDAGNDVGKSGNDVIVRPREAPVFCLATQGSEQAFEALRSWCPDLIFANYFSDTGAETELFRTAPTVYFAHNYHGTCISARKSFRLPRLEPCDRKFGAACLLQFYPRRCGGLSPVTMLQDYLRSARSLQNLGRCAAILVASEHMRLEYNRHGFANSVHVVGYPIPGAEDCDLSVAAASCLDSFANPARAIELLFAGRMVFAKGGHVLIQAMERVSRSIERQIHLTMLGDGPLKHRWSELAAPVGSRNPNFSFTFKGWQESEDLSDAIKRADLLVVPSLWPEPFGMIGPEAGIHAVPAAAFAVGGISEWLHEGINGHLAAAHPTTAEGLAGAIKKCLGDPAHYEKLRAGALRTAASFTLKDHLTKLMEVFEDVAKQRGLSFDMPKGEGSPG